MKNKQFAFLVTLISLAIAIVLPNNFSAPAVDERSSEMISARDELAPQASHTCCPILELRQYTLLPGKRDTLITLFEREFIVGQEVTGMTIVGQFRDLDNPNRFVWLRGFSDMPSRARSLTEFYHGPVWKEHREEANATMVDSSNVLLLHPALPLSGFAISANERTKASRTKGLIIATIYYFGVPIDDSFIEFFEHSLKPIIKETGGEIRGSFVTETSVNSFPALPVREGENVFVWFMRFSDQAEFERHLARLSRSTRWRKEFADVWEHRLIKPPEILRLMPTPHSQLH